MEEQTRIMLADYLQAAEIETHIFVQEEDSVRADWWRASCGLHDWYTTGSKPNVEDAAAHHVAWDHPACAAVDPDSPADTPVYCRQLPGHSDDHANGGRRWANDRKPTTTPGRANMTKAFTRNASHYFATDHDREAFIGMFGQDQLDALFTPAFAYYVRHGVYPEADQTSMPAPLADAELEAIRARNRRLRAVPWGLHDGCAHGGNCVPCEMVRSIGDASKLLEQLDYLAVPKTLPFAMQRPEYEVENAQLRKRAAEADLARVQAELRVAQLRLVLGSALRSFTKKRRRYSVLRSNWIKAAKVERWRRVYEETGPAAEHD